MLTEISDSLFFIVTSSPRSHLSVPQVANTYGPQQEDIVAVERRGPGGHFGGLGVHLVSPSYVEKPGVLFAVNSSRSARATLETDAQTPINSYKIDLNCLPGELSHLENDELPFEQSQELAGLLSHDHPDLHRGSFVFVINDVRLGGALCDLVFAGMAALLATVIPAVKVKKRQKTFVLEAIRSDETPTCHMYRM